MSDSTLPPDQHRRMRRMRKVVYFHYWIGLLFLPLIAILAVTGLLMNHTVSLGLNRLTLSAPWLHKWLKLPPPDGSSPPLTMDYLLLELHTGRIFGTYGTYLMDAAAIALFALAVSGLAKTVLRK